jgi:hypothetical protein
MAMTMKRARYGVVALVCVVAAPLALAACSSAKPGKSASGTTTTTTSKHHAKIPTPVDPRLTVVNNDAARRDSALNACQYGLGAWNAKGTVTNTTSNTATYTLQVTYTNTHATVIGVEKTTVTPGPKQTVDWSTAWPSSMQSGVVCVLDAVSRS